jgi:glycosyltransferase involved in cell wall biosynthesis
VLNGRRKNRVLFALYAHPAAYPPVERAAHLLRENGKHVRIVGARGLETDALAGDNLAGLEARYVSRAGTGIVQKFQYAFFLALCAFNLVSFRPRWVYASDSFAAPLGLLAALLGFRVLYHEHDTPVHDTPSLFIRLILRARRALLRKANLVVTPNRERSAAASREAAGREVMTIWNCPRRSEVVQSDRRKPRANRLRVVYHGSIVPGRTPLSLIDAVARVADVELDIAGYETIGSRGMVAGLIRRAEELGVADRVHAHPAMPRATLLGHAAECDLGLSLMPVAGADFNERTMAGASNKAFEYLACGLPLLVSESTDLQHLFEAREVALSCDPASPADIARVFEYALANRDELVRMGERGRTLVEREWNYETQFRPVLDRMDRV